MTEENLEKVVAKLQKIYVGKKIISGEPEATDNHQEFYIYDEDKEREIPKTSILYNSQTERIIIKTNSYGELEELFINQLNELGIKSKIRIETDPSYWNMLSEPLMENEPQKEYWTSRNIKKIKKDFIDIFTQ